jgi:hypothetical protein
MGRAVRRTEALLLLWASLGAHTFHYSKTEINWNTAARTLEMIVTLHADDLEAELRKAHPQLELDRDKEAEPLSCAYAVKALDLARLRPRCIGIKVSRELVEVYLEAAAAAPPARLSNRILIDDLPDQRNDVELRKDGKLAGPRIQFNTSETRKELRW